MPIPHCSYLCYLALLTQTSVRVRDNTAWGAREVNSTSASDPAETNTAKEVHRRITSANNAPGLVQFAVGHVIELIAKWCEDARTAADPTTALITTLTQRTAGSEDHPGNLNAAWEKNPQHSFDLVFDPHEAPVSHHLTIRIAPIALTAACSPVIFPRVERLVVCFLLPHCTC